MTRILTTLAFLAGLFIAVPSSASGTDPLPPPPPSPLAGLPDEVRDGQIVTLADGDLFEVTVAPQGRSVRGRRWDAATSSWGPGKVLFKDPDLRCWGSIARGSGSGVAVTASCGPTDVMDTAGNPYAIVSADTVNWSVRRLPRQGRWTPGLSPDGTHAAWANLRSYFTWSEATGFVRHPATPPELAFSEAVMIADDGAVTIAYSEDTCIVTLDTYPPAGPTRRQVLEARCAISGAVISIDANTLAFGDVAEPWSTARLTRPDSASDWVVSTNPPTAAPGLLPDPYFGHLAPMLFQAGDGPLAVVSNGPDDDLRVQLYDPAAESWLAPSTLFTRTGGTRCSFRDDASAAVGFYALSLGCRGPNRLVISRDGVRWQALPVRTRVIGANSALDLVAAADRRNTVIASRRGNVTLPVGSNGGCDIVMPVAPGRLIRLTAAKDSAGWPVLLQRSTKQGWRTVRRLRMPTDSRCDGVYDDVSSTLRFELTGPRQWVRVRFIQVNGRWDVRWRR